MGTFSIWHWLVVLAVVVLLFGTKKLRNLGGDLGAAVRGFKKGMKEDDAPGGGAPGEGNLDEPVAHTAQAEAVDTTATEAKEKQPTGQHPG